jgi:CheY-like chemotaxis protein
VAHDFNNLLTVITGYGEMVENALDPADPSRRLVREIIRSGERAAALTGQLLAFSRKHILAPRVVQLNSLVTEIEDTLRRLIGEEIEFRTVLDPTLRPVSADPSRIEQVIVNLVLNARDAMPRGGQLTVGTENVELEIARVNGPRDLPAGHYALLTVTDTGNGMDEETKANVFEPFFTTKEVGKGTGLGLATVYGIAKQSGGHIEVVSELACGTTFKLYLPQVDQEAPALPKPGPPAGASGGSETILLVEDEEGVRGLARIALVSQGYHVLEARDGAEAIKMATEFAGAIDMVITDVVMPRMSGREVSDSLAESRPGIKVLYVSGYTDDAIVRHGVCEKGTAFLHKPFGPATLVRKIRETLDGSDTRYLAVNGAH